MSNIECNLCKKKFELEESLSQHKNAVHKNEAAQTKKPNTKRYLIIFMLIASIAIISYSVYSVSSRPGDYDDFAKCLTEKGAIIYGNDFCSYTTKQLGFFGKSKEYLNYIKCYENKELCDQKGVKLTPTWEIEGKMYQQVQTFETLSQISGCKLQ